MKATKIYYALDTVENLSDYKENFNVAFCIQKATNVSVANVVCHTCPTTHYTVAMFLAYISLYNLSHGDEWKKFVKAAWLGCAEEAEQHVTYTHIHQSTNRCPGNREYSATLSQPTRRYGLASHGNES